MLSCEGIEIILYNELNMRKVTVRWVPLVPTPDRKRIRLITSRENLALFDTNPAGFLKRFQTQDEWWVDYFKPETIQAVQTAFLTCFKGSQGCFLYRE